MLRVNVRPLHSFTAIAATVLVVSRGNAQRSTPAVRLYAGGDRSIIQGDSISGPLHRTQFVGGVSLSWPLSARVAFEPAVEFAQKGTKSLDTWPSGPFTWSVRINYVEVPLLVRASTRPWRGLTPHLVVGPEMAFKAGCAVSVSGGAPGTEYVCEGGSAANNRVALTARPTKVDCGAIGGAGVDFVVGRRVLTLDARYDYGLKNMFENNDTKNRAFELLAGVRW